MTDYLKLELFLSINDEFLVNNLKYLGKNYQNERFEFSKNHSPIQITLNENSGKLIMAGSIPYFWQGHNLGFSTTNLIDFIDYCSELICHRFAKSEIKCFEYGTVVRTKSDPNYIFNKCTKINNYKKNIYQDKKGFTTGIEFTSSNNNLKFYNVKSSPAFKKIHSSLKTKIIGFNAKENYVRLENKILKPECYFFKNSLTLEYYITDIFQEILKNDLISLYQKIQINQILNFQEITKPWSWSKIYLKILLIIEPKIHSIIIDYLRELKFNGIINQYDLGNHIRSFKKDLEGLKASLGNENEDDFEQLFIKSLANCSENAV